MYFRKINSFKVFKFRCENLKLVRKDSSPFALMRKFETIQIHRLMNGIRLAGTLIRVKEIGRS
jgi:hypothetical protein